MMEQDKEISDREKRGLYAEIIQEIISPESFMRMVDYMCRYAEKWFPMESLYLTTHAPLPDSCMRIRFWKGRPEISRVCHPDIGTQADKFLAELWPDRLKADVLERMIREKYSGVTIVGVYVSGVGKHCFEGEWRPCEPTAMKDWGFSRHRYCTQTTLYELVKGGK